MKSFLKITGSVWIAATLYSCEPKPIDIDVKPAEARLVVSSQIVPQKNMIIALTKSFSPLDPISNTEALTQNQFNRFLVYNAFVTISYANIIDTLRMLTPGIYESSNVLLMNNGTYTLYARDPASGQKIMAVANLLPKVKFDTVYPIVSKLPTDSSVSVQYKLSDNMNEENYYVVNYILKQASTGANLDISSYFNSGSNKILSEFDLLSDVSFTNGSFSKETKLKKVKTTDTIAVEVANISKGYYEFLTAYKRSGDLINQLSGEPINYPSNVINGYGFFNAHYPDSRIFFLKEY
jgi:hypothetical protein